MSSELIIAFVVTFPPLITAMALIVQLLRVTKSTHTIVNKQRDDMLAEIKKLRKQIAGMQKGVSRARKTDGKQRKPKTT